MGREFVAENIEADKLHPELMNVVLHAVAGHAVVSDDPANGKVRSLLLPPFCRSC